MPKVAAILRKYPEQELAIRRLCRQDAAFMTACADFEDATIAIHHWEEADNKYAARADEYRHILSDLESEILERLTASRLRHTFHDT
jgi:biotin carboxylase